MKKFSLFICLALVWTTAGFTQNLLNDPEFTLETDPVGWFGWNGDSIEPITEILSVDGSAATFTPLSDVETVLNDGFAPWTNNRLAPGNYAWSVEVTEVTSDGTVLMYASWQDDTWSPAGAGRMEVEITEPGTYLIEFTLDEATAYFNQVGFTIEGWTTGGLSIENPALRIVPEPEDPPNLLNDPEFTLVTDPPGWFGWDGAAIDPITQVLSVEGTTATVTPLSTAQTFLNDGWFGALMPGLYMFSADISNITATGSEEMTIAQFTMNQADWGAEQVLVESIITGSGSYTTPLVVTNPSVFNQVGWWIEGAESGGISIDNASLSQAPNLMNDPEFTLETDPPGWFGWNGDSIEPITEILSIDGSTATFTPLSNVETVLNDGWAPWTGNQLAAGTYVYVIDVTEVTSDGTIMMYASWQDNTWSPEGAGRVEVEITGPGIYMLEFMLDPDTAYFNQAGLTIEGWTSGSLSFEKPSLSVIPAPNLMNDPDFTLETDPPGWFGWNGDSIDPITEILGVDGSTATFTPLSDVETVLNDGWAPWSGNQLAAGDYWFTVDVTEVTSDGSIMMYASWQDDTWSPAGAGREEIPIAAPGTYTVKFSLDSATAYFNQVGFTIEGWTTGSFSFENPRLNFVAAPPPPVAVFPWSNLEEGASVVDPWFGAFEVSTGGWIRHSEAHWIYVGYVTDMSNMWIYSLTWDIWVWSHSDLWPIMYNASTGSYIYYFVIPDVGAWLYDYSTVTWTLNP